MDFSIRLVQPAAREPITLEQAKNHLKIPLDLDEEDDSIGLYISAARDYLEQAYNVRFISQKLEILYPEFPCGDRFVLPVTPVQSVDYITYRQSDGSSGSVDVETNIRTALYRRPAHVVIGYGAAWPAVSLDALDGVQVGITAGFLKDDSPETLPIPHAALAALRLMLTHQYENRSAVTLGTLEKADALALGIDNLMANVRLF